jgi:alkanesulfonate monooxygenase SsuD/methylene tetrahydromethanopterin reductase-like flavin-dependent oxidoreductase (luciferase family)
MGRDPATLTLSVAQTLAVGADEAEVRRRAAAIDDDVDRLRHAGLGGTVGEVVDKLGRLGELGASRAYVQVLDLTDPGHLELVAAEVLPQL